MLKQFSIQGFRKYLALLALVFFSGCAS